MFNPSFFENSPSGGMSLLEVVDSPPTELIDEPRRQFVPLKRSELHGLIVGPLADLRLVQTFGYSRQQCDRAIEAAYRFPLPGDAAVTGVTVRFGDVEILATLKNRAAAEADYAAAKQAGKQTALLMREIADVFTLQVAGLQPDQDVMIETAYAQLCRADGLEWSLRVPLTTAPRFVRQDEVGSGAERSMPLALLRDPGHRFALDVTVQGAGVIRSTTHTLNVQVSADRVNAQRVRLNEGDVIPDRDCVLIWMPAQADDRAALQVFVHDDPASAASYFLAHVAPPAQRQRGGQVGREALLLVDHSGSMSGAKWEAADWAVERFLRDLTIADWFNLAWFHDRTVWFRQGVVRAEVKTVEEAIDWIKRNQSSGGTELGVALEQALQQARAPGELARHTLIVTDAAVTDEGRILRLVDDEAQRAQRRRISVLCIDAAPNAYLAQEIADRGGGVAKFLTSEPDAEDITTTLEQVLSDWAEPLLTGLRLEVNRGQVEAGNHQVAAGKMAGWSAIDLGDLPSGRSAWVIGRVARGEDDLLWRVQSGDGAVIAESGAAQAQTTTSAIKALFGARRVAGLEHLVNAGYDEAQLADHLAGLGYDRETLLAKVGAGGRVYAENRRAQASELVRVLLEQESLAYGLASSAAGFVALRHEAGEPVAGTVFVANGLAHGWSDKFLTGGGVFHLRARMSPRHAFLGTVGSMGVSSGANAAMAVLHDPAAIPMPAMSFDAPFAGVDGGVVQVFSGAPQVVNGQALLFDSNASATQVPDAVTFRRLTLSLLSGDPGVIEPDVLILLYVGDLVSPRATIRLKDLLRIGRRPLNVLRRPGDVVRLILESPPSVVSLPAFTLRLEWG